MIRVGVGGWTFAPWRNNFYPAKLPHKDELSFASRNLTTIEINGTFYRAQSPASFAKWREETPEGFVFAVKGHRAVVAAARLRDAGDAIGWFLASGILEGIQQIMNGEVYISTEVSNALNEPPTAGLPPYRDNTRGSPSNA